MKKGACMKTQKTSVKIAKVRFAVEVQRGEDGYWLISCPNIVGCYSQGTTKKSALENIREAIVVSLGG